MKKYKKIYNINTVKNKDIAVSPCHDQVRWKIEQQNYRRNIDKAAFEAHQRGKHHRVGKAAKPLDEEGKEGDDGQEDHGGPPGELCGFIIL